MEAGRPHTLPVTPALAGYTARWRDLVPSLELEYLAARWDPNLPE